MTETNDLITWDQPEYVGPLPNSDWTCPDPSTAFHLSPLTGGELTRDDVRDYFNGHDQHLEVYGYPEGMHCALPADNITGQLLYGTGSLAGYVNPTTDVEGHWTNVQPVSPLPLAPGKELESVSIVDGSFMTTVVPASGPDAVYPEKSKTRVSPGNEFLTVRGKARLLQIERGTICAGADQHKSTVSGFVALAQHAKGDMHTDENGVCVSFDGHGRLDHISLSDPKWLKKILGLRRAPSTLRYLENDNRVEIGDEPRIAQSIAELLHVETLEEIDLHLLASGLYAALGRPAFTPVHHIKPKE